MKGKSVGKSFIPTYRSNGSVILCITALLALIPASFAAYLTVDSNGCTIKVVRNETKTTAQYATHYPTLTTEEDCYNYCVNIVRPQPCIAYEFDWKNASYGCWIHTNPEDLEELFDADDQVIHIEITRFCPVTTRQSGQANVDSSASRQSILNLVAALSMLVSAVLLR